MRGGKGQGVKEVTRYKTDDGSEFSDKERALAHEALCSEVAAIMADWPAEPDGCDFANGHGYYQLSEALVVRTRNALLDIFERTNGDWDTAQRWIAATRAGVVDPSWVGRLIDDGGPHAIRSAWYRLMRVDRNWRFWGQLYYAAHPDQGDQVELGRTA